MSQLTAVSSDDIASAQGKAPAASNHDHDGSCRLLDTIPAEIRNKIYELAFTSEPEEDKNGKLKHQNLATPDPPNKSLLLTYRQIYGEAQGIYKTSYRLYWTGTPFICDYANWHKTLEKDTMSANNFDLMKKTTALIHQVASEDDLSHIKYLKTLDRRGKSFVLVDQCGIWRQTFWVRGPNRTRSSARKFHAVVNAQERIGYLCLKDAKSYSGKFPSITIAEQISRCMNWN